MLSTFLMVAITRDLGKTPFNLDGIGRTVDGKPAVFGLTKAKATVLFFISTDCPIANRYAPEIGRISRDYASKGVQSFRVYVTKKYKDVIAHGKEYKLNMPAVLDTTRSLTSKTGARVTPEAIVFNQKGTMVFRGRIDDQNVEHGAIRKDYRRDLRIALDETLAGKVVSMPEPTAIGCYL